MIVHNEAEYKICHSSIFIHTSSKCDLLCLATIEPKYCGMVTPTNLCFTPASIFGGSSALTKSCPYSPKSISVTALHEAENDVTRICVA
jgi:hypothetical protein